MFGIILVFIITGSLVLQALMPQRKMIIILCGAALSMFTSVIVGHKTMADIYRQVPWDVLVIIIGIGVYSSLFTESNIFSILAVKCSRMSRGNHLLLLILFSSIMFFLSGLLNNLTALLLIFPILIGVMKSLGTSQKFVGILFSLILVSCNLGGASTPIGDFPAILLMGTGSITFIDYLKYAYPLTLGLFLLLVLFAALFYLRRGRIEVGELESSFAIKTMENIYRRMSIDHSIFLPGILIFVVMFSLWIFGGKIGLTPDVVCLLGVVVLLVMKNRQGEEILRHKIDFESILYFAGLFIMVACLANSGILEMMVVKLSSQFTSPMLLVVSLMVLTGAGTALFSAGPSMATVLPMAQMIIAQNNLLGEAVYVGLALSVCAGSSFFLTAATSGPLAQSILEKTELQTFDGHKAVFNFKVFLPYGILAFITIQVIALIFVVTFLSL